jgi:hypothetical protein
MSSKHVAFSKRTALLCKRTALCKRDTLGAALALTLLLGCEGPAVSPIPAFADGGLLRLGPSLPQESHVGIEGRFVVKRGTNLLGDDVVLTTGKNTITLSSGKEAAVVALQGACLPDDRLILEGHWRYPRALDVGLIRMQLTDKQAAQELCAGMPTTRPVDFKGSYSYGNNALEYAIELTHESDLLPYRGRFFSVAHHGACEASALWGDRDGDRRAHYQRWRADSVSRPCIQLELVARGVLPGRCRFSDV